MWSRDRSGGDGVLAAIRPSGPTARLSRSPGCPSSRFGREAATSDRTDLAPSAVDGGRTGWPISGEAPKGGFFVLSLCPTPAPGGFGYSSGNARQAIPRFYDGRQIAAGLADSNYGLGGLTDSTVGLRFVCTLALKRAGYGIAGAHAKYCAWTPHLLRPIRVRGERHPL